jgi:hypothetical protein
VDAAEHAAIVAKLAAALAGAGIQVQRADVIHGNVVGWIDVSAEGVLGRWLQNGWRVAQFSEEQQSQPTRVLTLHREP